MTSVVAHAQEQFTPNLGRSALPINQYMGNGPLTTDIAVGDLNGDGVPDIVHAGLGGIASDSGGVYLQGVSGLGATTFLGHGSFYDVTKDQRPYFGFSHWDSQSSAVAIGDIDNDSDLDVVLCSPITGFLAMPLLNGGTPVAPVPFPGVPGGILVPSPPFNATNAFYPEKVRLGDVDGDGDLDCLICTSPFFPGTSNSRLLLFLNNGSGSFTEAPQSFVTQVVTPQSDAVLYDEDGDSDLDIFVVGQACHLLRNNGFGIFTDVTPAVISAITVGGTSVDAGDIDGDGLQDLVVGNIGSFVPGQPSGCYVITRSGGGGYQWTSLGLGGQGSSNLDVRLGDMDQDCDLDIVVSHDQARTDLLINGGTGSYTLATAALVFNDSGNNRGAMELVDVDMDGDLDIVLGNWSAAINTINILYNTKQDFDAPSTVHVAVAPSFSYDVFLHPGLDAPSIYPRHVFVGLNTVASSPLTGTALPNLRPDCVATADNYWLLGVTPLLVHDHGWHYQPAADPLVVPTAPSLVGHSLFAQAISFDLFDTYAFASPVTRTTFL